MLKCSDCAIGKGKEQSTDSDVSVESTRKEYWRILVDEASQFKASDFLVTKKDMIERTCEKLFNWKNEGKPIKYIRCDDGGENRGLKNRLYSSDWKLPIKFEFTGRDTPQLSGSLVSYDRR
jgi:hypothetical protein